MFRLWCLAHVIFTQHEVPSSGRPGRLSYHANKSHLKVRRDASRLSRAVLVPRLFCTKIHTHIYVHEH